MTIKKETSNPIITISIGREDSNEKDNSKSISIPYKDYIKLGDDLRKKSTVKKQRVRK